MDDIEIKRLAQERALVYINAQLDYDSNNRELLGVKLKELLQTSAATSQQLERQVSIHCFF